MKTIVITGASSGIGKATARHFAARGWNVAATMRKPEREAELGQLDNISLYALDVTDEASVASATEQIIIDFCAVAVVLNNAGYAVTGAFEATSQEQIQQQFDVNVFGVMKSHPCYFCPISAQTAPDYLSTYRPWAGASLSRL